MATKEAKALLKQAREAIRAKDFKEALKHCKAVLKADKTNYNALVFVGVAAEGLEQPDQALAAYKRAIDAEPEQLLAWQGLCGFYEKSGNVEYQPDLVNVYTKLIALLEKDAARKHEISVKLAQLHQSLGNVQQSVALYRSLLDETVVPPAASTEVWHGLVTLLGDQQQPSQEDTALLHAAYSHLVEEEGSTVEIWTKHIAALLKDPNPDVCKLQESCDKMRHKFPGCAYPLAIKIQLELDKLPAGSEPEPAMSSLASELASVAADSPYLSLWNGYWCAARGQHKEAADLLKTGLSVCSLLSGWVVLTKALIGMYDHKSALKTLEKVLKLKKSSSSVWTGDSSHLQNVVDVLKAEALLLTGTTQGYEEALQCCEKVLSRSESDPGAALCQVKVHLAKGDTQTARQGLERLMGLGVDSKLTGHMEGQCLILEGHLQQAQESLSAACEKHGTSSPCWFWMGRLLWSLCEAGDHTHASACGEALLTAAKLDPFYSATFLYLGHYYGKLLGDGGKARRCYQKAYELDRTCEAAGCALVDALVDQQEQAFAKSLLLSVTSQANAGCAKWAWLRLGLQQIQDDEPTPAITSLQAALRADPTDNHVWECLGEAYLKRGSYTAAMKAFMRGAELQPDSIYCCYQVASIKQTVGTYVESVAEYEGILKKHLDYVPALKGAGESMIELAKDSISKFFHGRAVDQCQAALPHLTRAASLRPDLSCLWKLLGDACTILYPLPEAIVKVAVPAKLLDTEADIQETKELGRRELITLGGRCYGMALKQLPDCAALWHDLGVNYFYQSQLAGSTSGEQLAGRAVQALQKAVSQDPACHRHWTALGVVAASEEVNHPALAQHAFIKSTQVEQCNVAAWTNLGTLYLKHDQTKLAHKAFEVAQSLEPSFVASWVGDALIAESVGHDDAMDLFRHTTELGNQVEGSIGYAHWVCSTLREKGRLGQELYQYCIERMAAVPAAADALAKYTDRVRDNASAYNMHGLLLERLQLYQQAALAFHQARELLTEDRPLYLLCKANYARMLGKLGRYKESIVEFDGLTVELSVEDFCWKGLACYHVENYTESVTAYGQALERTKDAADRSHLEAALGMVLYKAGDIEAAKSAFFRSFQCEQPSRAGLEALCALGLLQQDMQLAGAALAELDKQEDSLITSAHLAALKAHVADMQGDYLRARNTLAAAVHQHPDNYLLWRHLATFLLKHPRGKSSVAAHCAKLQALSSGGDTQAWSSVMSLSGLAGGLHSRRDPNNNGLRLAQKALHLYPDSLSNWCGLLSALYGELVLDDGQSEQHYFNLHHSAITLAAHLMAKVESDLQHGERSRQASLKTFHLWCVQQYVLLLIGDGRTEPAAQFLQQATWLYDSDPTLRALHALLGRDFKAMRGAAQDAKDVFPGQILHVALAEEGLQKELRKAINLHIKYANSMSSKISCLVELALLSYQQLLLPDCDVNRWGTAFEEACNDALDLQPDCPAIHLLLGLRAAQQGEYRLARHHADLVLEGERSGSSGALASQARRLLLQVYMAKKDSSAVQALLDAAAEDKDQDLLDFYSSL